MKKLTILVTLAAALGAFYYFVNRAEVEVRLNETKQDYAAQRNEGLFLSPDGKFVAVDVSEDVGGYVYIRKINGERVTGNHDGGFISWSPDSQYIYVSVPFGEKPGIYKLGLDNIYTFGDLPEGTFDAAIAPAKERLVYTVRQRSGEEFGTTIWIRNVTTGESHPFFSGDGHSIFAWLRWSPAGDKIAFLQADERHTKERLILAYLDGTAKEISRVIWNYPPVWSADGNRLLFVVPESDDPDYYLYKYKSLQSNLWEYDLPTDSLRKLTNFIGKRVLHPIYTPEGDIAFISNESGANEIWILKDGKPTQLTNDGKDKWYPVLP